MIKSICKPAIEPESLSVVLYDPPDYIVRIQLGGEVRAAGMMKGAT